MANAPTYLNHSGVAEDAQGVIIVNPDGTFADMSGAGGGGTVDGNVGILNDSDAQINPAREETLIEVRDELTDQATALGQATMANSLPIAIASNQSAVPVTIPTASSATETSLASAASSGTVLAANAARKGCIIQNTDANAVCVRMSSSAATTAIGGFSFRLAQYETFFGDSSYTGAFTGIWEGDGAGGVTVSEW